VSPLVVVGQNIRCCGSPDPRPGNDPTAEQVGATPVVAHDLMSREYTIKEEGYVFMYVSNENATLVDVYFDDIVMTP